MENFNFLIDTPHFECLLFMRYDLMCKMKKKTCFLIKLNNQEDITSGINLKNNKSQINRN